MARSRKKSPPSSISCFEAAPRIFLYISFGLLIDLTFISKFSLVTFAEKKLNRLKSTVIAATANTRTKRKLYSLFRKGRENT